jgi:hypothetical protein
MAQHTNDPKNDLKATTPEVDPDIKYVRNPSGEVHSVTKEHYDEVISLTLPNGRTVLQPGWEDVDEATAKQEQPQLFGALDPNVRMNYQERQDVISREKFEADHPTAGA